MIVYKNKLYMAAGGMQMACLNKQEMGITIFDGQYFDSLPGETNGIKDFCIYQDSLVAGGNFLYAGYDNFPSVNYTHELAYWDGTNWLNTGLWSIDGSINAVAVYNGELYVGGYFTQINTQPFNRIAKWNGTQWTSVGGGFLGNCNVECMKVYNGQLYVGGSLGLPILNPNSYYNCVRWNGTQWDSVGGKFGPGRVFSFCNDTITNKLYIGGPINYAGNNILHTVAAWDGSNLSVPGWCPIEGRPCMSMYNNELYVGGLGFNDTVLTKYNGSSWTNVEIAPNIQINSLCVYTGNLYVGGWFDSIGGIYAPYIACYGNNCPQGVGIKENKKQLEFKIFPNPAKTELNILIHGEAEKSYTVKIYNTLGEKMTEEKFSKQTKVNTSSFAKGVYQVQVCNAQGNICHTEKLIIQ